MSAFSRWLRGRRAPASGDAHSRRGVSAAEFEPGLMQQATHRISSSRPSRETVHHAYAKVTRRLVLFLSCCFVLAYLDRLNIGFAKLQLASELRLSDTAYGLGAGVFFLGYLLFEIPGNLLLARIGARVWLACLMIAWGAVSMATAFVHSIPMLYLARFLLGAAEAGFFPGSVYYLTSWFPDARRARVVAVLITALALSGVIGGPIAGGILQNLSDHAGLHGWQWLFVLEGLPSVIAGVAALFVLDDTVAQATWLTPEERAVIAEAIDAEQAARPVMPALRALADGRVWLLGFIYFCFCMGLYGVGFWLPQLLKNAGAGDVLHVGLLSAVPYGVAIPLMTWTARSSDASGKRRRYIGACAACGVVGFTLSALHGTNLPIALVALTLANAGVLTAFPLLWTLPTGYFSGSAAAAGIALVNSLGASAGFLSPYLIGAVHDATGSTVAGLLAIACFVGVGGALVALVGAGTGGRRSQ